MAAGRRILNLDLDLSGLYAMVRREKALRWIADTGSGRLLRSPTVFEDLVKLVLTTNCSWSLTTRMVNALVERYGEESSDGSRSFPTPRTLTRAGEGALRRARLGYRAPYLVRVARAVTEGSVEPESWEGSGKKPGELKAEMMALPGVGPYVAENLLKMLGRPDGLALDSWMRAKYARLYHGGRRVSDRTIARRYRRLGAWAGIAVWCELTRDWLEGDGPEWG